MATEQTLAAKPERRSVGLSLDWWAVLTALILAGIIPT